MLLRHHAFVHGREKRPAGLTIIWRAAFEAFSFVIRWRCSFVVYRIRELAFLGCLLALLGRFFHGRLHLL